MVITPLEILNHEFQKKMRGVDPEEVKAFLGLVAEEFEKLVVSNGKLQDEVTELRERLGELRDRERILKETMVTAQKLSQQIKEEAQKARDVIVRDAETKAERVIAQAQHRVSTLESAIIDLRLEREALENNLKHMLEHHLKAIEVRKEEEEVAARLRFMPAKQAAASAGGGGSISE